MQKIDVKFLPAGRVKGSRLKAYCERGSLTLDCPHELHRDEWAEYMVKHLVAKFLKEDEHKYQSNPSANPWAGPWAVGENKSHWSAVNVRCSPPFKVDL
jgi:hypothetical protein